MEAATLTPSNLVHGRLGACPGHHGIQTKGLHILYLSTDTRKLFHNYESTEVKLTKIFPVAIYSMLSSSIHR